jgi:hypothetical protein
MPRVVFYALGRAPCGFKFLSLNHQHEPCITSRPIRTGRRVAQDIHPRHLASGAHLLWWLKFGAGLSSGEADCAGFAAAPVGANRVCWPLGRRC